MVRKGCYPNDYFLSFAKFNEISLPPKSAFFNSLSNEEVSFEDYQYAQRIWDIFNVQTLGDFHDLYVTSNVLLLADVSENFREVCLNLYGLIRVTITLLLEISMAGIFENDRCET
ncbi:hypothetical protein AVEN_73997-1 [Araneus ventricosus]|uniref:Uncharacterized protein n=1 Tax=Araneus ventricosus TaxID=182803 RepID=A0A4Y2NV99_ARAVE|nr:hypothetical protein AVEN_73997-1 [Araneus ventricosus]